MLKQLNSAPHQLLALEANDLHEFLGGPTLIHIPGRQQLALFVSVLMHGNETTGWDAIRNLLRQYLALNNHQALPRSLNPFIGNTQAAKHGLRHLSDQLDYNRVWPGSELEYTI